jgi:hypothetical protein
MDGHGLSKPRHSDGPVTSVTRHVLRRLIPLLAQGNGQNRGPLCVQTEGST